jgi:hypothetical protein
MGENHRMISYIYQEFIHRKHQLPNSPAATGRRLQPPILRLQPEGSYNSLNSLAPTRRRLQPPGFSWLQPEGGYNHLVLRLQPEGSSNSLILWLQLEGGYNPLSLPHPTTLKYKCRPTVTTTITATITVTVTVTVINLSLSSVCHVTVNLSTCPTNHCLIHETRSTLIHMQLMPRSPRAYLKPYAQHHQHMPLPSMYQDHHIPSQDMCLNQVPTCTMYQPCINLCTSTCTINHVHQQLVPQQVHQPCTNTCTKHVHQPCTSTCTMYINHAPSTSTTIPSYHVSSTMCHQPYAKNHVPCTIPCTIPISPYHANHVSTMYQPYQVSQPYTISCHTPYANKPRYEPTMYLTK